MNFRFTERPLFVGTPAPGAPAYCAGASELIRAKSAFAEASATNAASSAVR